MERNEACEVKNKMKKIRNSKKNVCSCDGHCWHPIVLTKLSLIALILFLITVWPALMNLVHSIHWGWFLGAFLVLGAFALMKMKNCCGKK